MSEPISQQVLELREQVSHAEYRVDTRAVAEAIVRRRWAVSLRARPVQARVKMIARPSVDEELHALAA